MVGIIDPSCFAFWGVGGDAQRAPGRPQMTLLCRVASALRSQRGTKGNGLGGTASLQTSRLRMPPLYGRSIERPAPPCLCIDKCDISYDQNDSECEPLNCVAHVWAFAQIGGGDPARQRGVARRGLLLDEDRQQPIAGLLLDAGC